MFSHSENVNRSSSRVVVQEALLHVAILLRVSSLDALQPQIMSDLPGITTQCSSKLS